ncbi:MAG: alpha-amylase [Bacillota bacterium]|nr:alpha-amylase [Bacillota bacterium]
MDSTPRNSTLMQYFEWYLPPEGNLWLRLKEDANRLSSIGITALWLPPAYKGEAGIHDVGYGAYDLYDLGEFNQKSSIPTKYGTKQQYLEAIKEVHKYSMKVYADIVLDHKAGADDTEIVNAIRVERNNRNIEIGRPLQIEAWTQFNYTARGDKYSSFKWNWSHFSGVDWDNRTKENSIFKFCDVVKHWTPDVDNEFGNFDYLMHADLNMNNEEVIDELLNWGKWYLDTTDADGFRLDAVKHIKFSFFKNWLKELKSYSPKELFTVGEYWSGDINKLINYINHTDNLISLFDVPLHYNFANASNSYNKFDMRKLSENTLMSAIPDKAVTFVDNHDTEPGQSLESWVQPWFKPLAYTFILTRMNGLPCIFYGDYYGIPFKNQPPLKDILDVIIKVRRDYAYGLQHDYFDDYHCIGWTREGDDLHDSSGLAALITNGTNSTKHMYVGKQHSGKTFYDCTGNIKKEITINDSGFGEFAVNPGSHSIWIHK